MVHPFVRCSGFGLAVLLAGPAGAQPAGAAKPAAADPADARAAVPALVWRSPFANPDAIRLAPALAWKEANDQVLRIGGWRAYARQASEPDAPAGKPAAAATGPDSPSTPAMPPPGSAHGGHGARHKP